MGARARNIRDDLGVERGAFYTPPFLANWIANEVFSHLPAGPLTVLDPACGTGRLLESAKSMRPGLRLLGIERSEADAQASRSIIPTASIMKTDALAHGLPCTLRPFGFREKWADAVLANPPWGIQLRQDGAALRTVGFKTAVGQFDSFAPFCELSLNLLRPDGVAGFIIPDSVFESQNRPFRQILTRNQILLIARLGEGIFDGVFRGTAVVIVKKRTPDDSHLVRSFVLRASDRKAIIERDLELRDAVTRANHLVPQARFSSHPELKFEVAIKPEFSETIEKIRTSGDRSWTGWFDFGRGVEISKHGSVVACYRCGAARPAPRKPRNLDCLQCGQRLAVRRQQIDRVVRTRARAQDDEWAPLIVGEDVRRYSAVASREIRTAVKGIRYKPIRAGRFRCLVRKTGIGIHACKASGSTQINQVVFSLDPKETCPDFMLDYVVGMLNSRTMLAFHLVTTGDLEWKSHPYLTQTKLQSFPIPSFTNSNSMLRRARQIASIAGSFCGSAPIRSSDMELEGLVMRQFGLSHSDVGTIARILDSAGELEAVRDLRFMPSEIKLGS